MHVSMSEAKRDEWFGVSQPAELCEFQPASADDVRRIIVQSSSKSCELTLCRLTY